MGKLLQFESDLNNKNQFNLLSENEKEHLIQWIETNLLPYKIKSFNESDSSMTLKRLYENGGGSYVSNGAFKGAMLKAGFKVKDESLKNWSFNISKKRVNDMI